jgi:putative phosphoribosyl transferase
MREFERTFFADRNDAGRRLATELLAYKDARPVVLALPRGGVVIGYEVACRLHAPLDIVLVRKIGAPQQPELAIGAIVEGNPVERFINQELVAELQVPASYVEKETEREKHEIERRRLLYFEDRRPVAVQGRTAIVVDDGIATGATMRAALAAVGRRRPSQLVLAVPVAPAQTIEDLRDAADEIVCLMAPEDFGAIGLFYRDFHQLDDQSVIALLTAAAKEQDSSARQAE